MKCDKLLVIWCFWTMQHMNEKMKMIDHWAWATKSKQTRNGISYRKQEYNLLLGVFSVCEHCCAAAPSTNLFPCEKWKYLFHSQPWTGAPSVCWSAAFVKLFQWPLQEQPASKNKLKTIQNKTFNLFFIPHFFHLCSIMLTLKVFIW